MGVGATETGGNQDTQMERALWLSTEVGEVTSALFREGEKDSSKWTGD